MAELCLTASHGYPPGLLLNQELSVSRVFKDCQSFPANSATGQEIAGAGFINLSPIQSRFGERWELLGGLPESNQFVKFDSAVRSPVIIDVLYCRPTSELLTFPTSENPTRHEEMLHFHIPGSHDPEKFLEDVPPLLANSVDIRAIMDELLTRKVMPPLMELYSQQSLVDFVGHLARDSKITIHPDGQVEFSGSKTEMKDLLSIVAEFYISRNSNNLRARSLLVPQFNSYDIYNVRSNSTSSSLKLEAVTVPLKSPEKIKTYPSPRKTTRRKPGKDRDMYKRNSFHACETLLSLLMDKNRERASTVLSLMKAGPELPELLNRFSAGIGGSGIAVLFSVISSAFRTPFCASKLLSTGLGFGLVWLSWAVNKLSSTVGSASRGSGKVVELKEKEMVERVDKGVKEIQFRAGIVMALVALRFV